MTIEEEYRREVERNIDGLKNDHDVQALSRIWVREIARHKYAYNFTWLGRPAIQFPNDPWALQEIIWSVKPDLIIETGIAHGGSVVFSASMLALLDMADAIENKEVIDPAASKRKVIAIDIDIREHNRKAIQKHPFASRIHLIEGSSISETIIDQVKEEAKKYNRILVCLDSNHTHDHVLSELEAYAPLVSPGSYCVVYDTLLEDMPAELSGDRSWAPGNSPKTAVKQFMTDNQQFVFDTDIPAKLLITVAPGGYLKRKE